MHQIHNLVCLPHQAQLDLSCQMVLAQICFIASSVLPYLTVQQSFNSFLADRTDALRDSSVEFSQSCFDEL